MTIKRPFGVGFLGLISLLFLCMSCSTPPKKAMTIEDLPDYKEALNQYNLGLNYVNQSKPAEALQYLKKAVELEPKNFRYNHWLGFAQMLTGDLTNAEIHFKKAIEINPEHTDSYNNLASIYIDTQRYAEAQEYLKTVIKDTAYPAPQLAYYNLGLCYLKHGQDTEAIAAFEQSIYLNKDFYRAYFAIGEIYQRQEKPELALRYLLMAEKGYPNDVNVLYAIGKTYFQANKYPEAQRYLTQVSILFPSPEIDGPTQKMLEVIGKQYE